RCCDTVSPLRFPDSRHDEAGNGRGLSAARFFQRAGADLVLRQSGPPSQTVRRLWSLPVYDRRGSGASGAGVEAGQVEGLEPACTRSPETAEDAWRQGPQDPQDRYAKVNKRPPVTCDRLN